MFFSVLTTLVVIQRIQSGFCLSFHSVNAVVPRQQSSPAVGTTPLVNFAVSQPVNFPGDTQSCTIELIHHLFANSYYNPAIIDYSPPTDCGDPGTWSGLSLNWTATSNGTQYDRLSGVTLSNVEIWRTSTAEPTRDGILWTVVKDVTKYLPLFSKPGRMILDLNNVIDLNAGINGEYDVRLSLTVYGSSEFQSSPKSASLIIPLSTLKANDSNAASVPPVHSNTVSLPRNAIQAFVEIQASGNAQEEFWYFNVPDAYLDKLPADTTYGKGSFREVRITVDGQLAGVAFPYPVLFTGAIVPSVWRPIPAYGAFDLPTYNVDLTPWVPLLADGQSHTIGLEVVSSEADGSINNNWYVSGNIQVITGSSDKPTTGLITSYHTDANYTAGFAQAGNGDQTFTVTANRQLEVSAQVISGDGTVNNVVWKQALEFSNTQGYLDKNTRQTAKQLTTGTSVSTHNSKPAVSDVVDFPLDIDFFLTSDNTGSGFTAIFDHSYTRSLLPSPLLTWSNITSVQHANGTYITQPATGLNRHANGTNTNTFQYIDVDGNTYNREVGAENNVITYDTETGTLARLQFIKPDSFSAKAAVDPAELIVGRLPGGRQFPGMKKDKALI